jgi:hypothetical protein
MGWHGIKTFMRSIIKVITAALRASLTGPGLLGWLIALIKPITKVLSMTGNIDLLANYFGPAGRFLDTGWGTLASIVLGAVIIGYAIHRRMQLEPIMAGGDKAESSRIPILNLLSEATAKGWIFNRDTLQTFMQTLRQSASEGSVVIWGVLENGRDLISAPSLYVAEKIPASYFKEHWIDAHQGWVHNENRYVRTSVPSGRNKPNLYSNLHVERGTALAWLESIKR